MSTLLENEKVSEKSLEQDAGDHDRFAHVFKNKDVDRAVFTGEPAVALCGKKDIPLREVKKYPVCPTCKELYESLLGD